MQIMRYVANGLFASAVHFSVLTFCVEVLQVESVGLANAFAAAVGIATSFLGSRYFVFRRTGPGIHRQAFAFVALYGLLALAQGAILYAWTDVGGFDYRIGFIVATCFQVVCSYVGNKKLVFKA